MLKVFFISEENMIAVPVVLSSRHRQAYFKVYYNVNMELVGGCDGALFLCKTVQGYAVGIGLLFSSEII